MHSILEVRAKYAYHVVVALLQA